MDRVAETIGGPILLTLATALRRLANDPLCRGDRALYLRTAEALEKRAELFAATFPHENIELLDDHMLHRPVDMTI